MIIGMVPMALGLGEAGEQNAPLGRAVIGGLIVATFVDAVHRADLLHAAAAQAAEPAQPRRALRGRGGGRARDGGRSRMARRGRFGSFLVYLSGCWWSAAPRCAGVHLWQQKDAQLVASREAMAEGLAQGPARAGRDDRAGTEGAADHAARRYAAVSDGDAVRQGRRLSEVDRGGSRRPREGRAGRGRGGVGGDRPAVRLRR